MTAIRTFAISLWMLLFAVLAGCGGDDDGAPSPSPPDNGSEDVELEQLSGDWLGTFDSGDPEAEVVTFQFTVDDADMSDIVVDGEETILTGSITKATEVSQGFRFVLNVEGTEVVRGIMIVDPSASHMLYLHDNFQFGVLQKGADEVPEYEATDIDKAWEGVTMTATEDFTTLTQTDSSGTCEPADPATDPPTSECTFTIDGTTRTVSELTLDDERGRWVGTFSDDPASEDPREAVATRMYLSPDKRFTAAWACTDFADGFPQTCDFSAWEESEDGEEQDETEETNANEEEEQSEEAEQSA